METHNFGEGLPIITSVGGGAHIIGSSSDHSNTSHNMDHMYGMATDPKSPIASSNGGMSNVAGMRGRSKVWNEFTVTPDGKKVTCRLCGDCLAYSNSHSTSSMLKHLKRKHNLDLYPNVAEDECGSASGPDRGIRSPSSTDKNNRPKPKKHIPKDAEEIDTSIQHGPLLFKDPCVRMKWTDHSDTFLRTFSSLYSDESYTDVTLVVEKHFFKAHRVILSSASEFFDETFKMTPSGQHPIIFLKDVKAMDLRILLDFIYKGEVSIPPSLIPGLVKIGGDLRVRGLSDFVWNEQLASSIFQPQPQPSQAQAPQNEMRNIRNPPPLQSAVQQPSPQQVSTTNQFSQTVTSTPTNPVGGNNVNSNRVFTPLRTVVRQAQPAPMTTSPGNVQSQQHNVSHSISNGGMGAPRTYSRILNIRPTNSVTNDNIQGQIITGDLSSSMTTSFPAMKRIRIVAASGSALAQKPGGCRMGAENSNLQTLSTNESAASAETVLMVTNEGETVLSTTQGGVTVLTPNSSMALPVGLTLKDSRFSHANQIPTFQNSHNQSQPVTVLTSSQGQAHTQQLDEVVYSITELSDDAHEVLMTEDSDMVVCGDESVEMVDKKPFLSP